MANLGEKQIADLVKLMADIRNPIADTRKYLDLGEIDGVSYSQELQPKKNDSHIIKTGHTFHFKTAETPIMRGWLCNDCYERIVAAIPEVEFFATPNLIRSLCVFCKKSEGKYNFVIAVGKIQMKIINKWLEEMNG